jgi:hypothetical protein
MNVLRLLLALLTLGWITDARADAVTQANQMLSFFSSNCPSQGQWTQTALNYANNLITTLKAIGNDPDCKSLNGALSQLQSLSVTVGQLGRDESERTLMALKKQQEEVLLMLAASNDATLTTQLTSQLQSLNLKIAEAQSYRITDGADRSQRNQATALGQLVSGTNIILQQAAQNAVCLDRNPGILPAIAGLAGSVQSALMTSGYSMIVAAGAELINGVVEGIRKTRIGRRINKMSSAITAQAYQCVLESLSNQWCSSQDALEVIRLKGRSIIPSASPAPIEQGINLLHTDYEIFMAWLETLRAGTDPANQATSIRQAAVLDRDRQVRSARLNGLGIIAENAPVFNRTVGEEARWRFQLQVMNSIVGTLLGNGTGPLADVFGANPFEQAPWFLIGVADSAIPRDPNTGARRALAAFAWKDIPGLVGNSSFKPDLGVVQRNMLEWVKLARDRVNTELSLILNLDPLKLMVNAATPGLNGFSPYGSLKKLVAFMKTQAPDVSTYGSFRNIYGDTVKRLETILKNIENTLDANPDEMDPVSAAGTISNVFQAAVLENGIGFLGDRLSWALRLSLNQLVTSGQSGVSNAQAAALLASNDILTELQKMLPESDMNAMARDIQNSQVVLESTLQSFTDQFGKGIRRTMEEYESQASTWQQDSEGTSRKALAEICLKLLAVPVWPERIPVSICEGKKLNSVFQDGPSSLTVSGTLAQGKHKERVCAFRDYQRKNRMYQFYRERKLSLGF